MTTNLHARAAKVAELNAKRTSGEWRVMDRGEIRTVLVVTEGEEFTIAQIIGIRYLHGKAINDAAAIAALPDAFALIAELDAALTSAEAKLTGIEPKEKP